MTPQLDNSNGGFGPPKDGIGSRGGGNNNGGNGDNGNHDDDRFFFDPSWFALQAAAIIGLRKEKLSNQDDHSVTILVDSDLSSQSDTKSSRLLASAAADSDLKNLSKGTSTLLSNAGAFWSGAVSNLLSNLTSFRLFGKRKPSEEESEIQRLKSTVITTVQCNSTILSPSIIQTCATRSGLIGSTLSAAPVQEMARLLKQHYQRNGYALSSMTGATLLDDAGVVEVTVEEPILSSEPVAIAFAKKMVLTDMGDVVSLREYKNTLKPAQLSSFDPKNLNTTYVQMEGKTWANIISKAMGFTPGTPFQWKERDWRDVERSSVFSDILHAKPYRLSDGTVQFRLIAME